MQYSDKCWSLCCYVLMWCEESFDDSNEAFLLGVKETIFFFFLFFFLVTFFFIYNFCLLLWNFMVTEYQMKRKLRFSNIWFSSISVRRLVQCTKKILLQKEIAQKGVSRSNDSLYSGKFDRFYEGWLRSTMKNRPKLPWNWSSN